MVPPQDRVRRHDRGYLYQEPSPEPFPFHRQATPLIVVQSEPAFLQLLHEHSVLFDQVLEYLGAGSSSLQPSRGGSEAGRSRPWRPFSGTRKLLILNELRFGSVCAPYALGTCTTDSE